jgi:hypothetical protein
MLTEKKEDNNWFDIEGLKEQLNLFRKIYHQKYGVIVGDKLMSIHYNEKYIEDPQIKPERIKMERELYSRLDKPERFKKI